MSPEKRKATSQGGKPKKAKTERQGHGLVFEDWLNDEFFKSCHVGGPTDHWDFTGVVYDNAFGEHTDRYSGLPISAKTCQEGKAIGFADVMRQFDNKQDFLLIAAFYTDSGSSKEVTSVVSMVVNKTVWHDLFGKITRKEINDFDKFVKNNKKDKETARDEAQTEKKKLPKSIITINPKIDEKTRRVQCSLSYRKFWKYLAKASPTKTSILWGEKVPNLQ